MCIRSILNLRQILQLRRNTYNIDGAEYMLEIDMVKECYSYIEQKEEYKKVVC